MIIRLMKITSLFILGLVWVSCQSRKISINEEINTNVVESPLPVETPLLLKSLYVANTFQLPHPDCHFEHTNAPNAIFYTCPEQIDLAGLWMVNPILGSNPVRIASPDYYQPIALLSPNYDYLVFRNTQTSLQVVSTIDWQLVQEIEVSQSPPFIMYTWLPDSSGLVITYPSYRDSLGIVYLTGLSETILSREHYDVPNIHPTGGIRLDFAANNHTNDHLLYSISDPNNYRPEYIETYAYDITKKHSFLLFRGNDTENFTRNIFNYVGKGEIVVSSTRNQRDTLGYYAINIETQEQKLIYPHNLAEPLKIIGESFSDNMIAVVTVENEHKLVDLNNGEEVETNVSCTEFVHTQWSSNQDFVIIFCDDSVWLFYLQTQQAIKVHDEGFSFWSTYVWEWYEDGQQMFALPNDDVVTLIYFK